MPLESLLQNDDPGPRDIKSCVISAVDRMESILSGRGPAGLKTGFSGLDQITNGLQGGDMFVLSARPGMGKSSLMLNIVENISILRKNQVPGAIFSLEASAELIVQRMIATLSGVPLYKMRAGFIGKRDIASLTRTAGTLAESPVWIEDKYHLSIDEFQSSARELKERHNIGYIVIDYLQNMSTAPRGNRDTEIGDICVGIKQTARVLEIPIFVIAQLGRRADSRSGHPRLSDLRESGAIENEADIVAFLTRENFYTEEDYETDHSQASLFIAKHRNGPTGDLPLSFDTKLMRFSDRP